METNCVSLQNLSVKNYRHGVFPRSFRNETLFAQVLAPPGAEFGEDIGYGGNKRNCEHWPLTQAVRNSRTTIWRVCLVTSHLKRMVCYKPFSTHNRYTHTHNGLACKVCTTRQAQSHTPTASHSLHNAKRTHSGRDLEKRCCRGQYSVKIETYFQKQPRRRRVYCVRSSLPHATRQTNRKNIRPDGRENGQKKPNGQSPTRTVNQTEVRPNFWNFTQNAQSGSPALSAVTVTLH